MYEAAALGSYYCYMGEWPNEDYMDIIAFLIDRTSEFTRNSLKDYRGC